ncbi:Mth938-like domain-containing protein [Craterilacuibacter sp. RT1T]|uniref:Mth938-like domain-containing protein n=1 Tax=Craterilacuibacter sp. RT1T TaxID=2942211 RepID=UPI0020C017CF|nr:Mth938-like domain-containing protein [Craterilacuibacter sp. RT1T]MCL6263732.1 Mth938-like domain-containing protein [Craterilacuibacter sp. RT1T]
MKLHQAQLSGHNLFTGYGEGFVEINQQRHEGALIITGETVQPWQVGSFAELTPENFAALLPFSPEVVLFGSGSKQRFPHPRLYAALSAQHIGVEVMDTQAACRTYNILLSEGRRVLLAVVGE